MTHLETIQLNCTDAECQNLTDFIEDNSTFVYNQPQNFVLICLYIPLFVTALVSNIFLIVNVSRNQHLRSATNCLLVNLSVSDLLVTLLCMPMAVGQATYSLWILGNLACKLSNYLQGVAVISQTFTTAALSAYRYMSCQPSMSQKIISRQRVKKVIVSIWSLALIMFVPILIIRKTQGFHFAWEVEQTEFVYCVELWSNNFSQRVFGILYFLVVYVIPGIIVIVSYSLMALQLCSHCVVPEHEMAHTLSASNASTPKGPSLIQREIQERNRLAKRLIAHALVFLLSWLPYSVLTLILDLNSYTYHEAMFYDTVDDQTLQFVANIVPYALLLGHTNAVINPIFYCMLSKKFCKSAFNFMRNQIRYIRAHCQFKVRFRNRPRVIQQRYSDSIHSQIDSVFYCQLNDLENIHSVNNSQSYDPVATTPNIQVYSHSSQYPDFSSSSTNTIKTDTSTQVSSTCYLVDYDTYWAKNVAHSTGGSVTITLGLVGKGKQIFCDRMDCSYRWGENKGTCMCFLFRRRRVFTRCREKVKILSRILEHSENLSE